MAKGQGGLAVDHSVLEGLAVFKRGAETLELPLATESWAGACGFV